MFYFTLLVKIDVFEKNGIKAIQLFRWLSPTLSVAMRTIIYFIYFPQYLDVFAKPAAV